MSPSTYKDASYVLDPDRGEREIDEAKERGEYDTFEAYCRERWGMTSRRARQLQSASKVVETIEQSETGTMVPKSERAARPLTKLPEDEQAEAWEEAA